ncbi:hypothetical protein SAMN04487900_102127 [Prevotella communis]|uniref:Uncharacterized protein n=1 Tax=Prevotella communis TaxID=2913614 RepID=A0A1H0DR08_9BACT|nr:hypothetical protein [Prevotella communis]SDN72610.1 hypothetical protein SAMN04487900_102127 [Prevotella communis]
MKTEPRIIAVHKANRFQAHQYFTELMKKTERILNEEAKNNPLDFKNLSASALEDCSLKTIRYACNDTPFEAEKVMLISGQKFPDIVSNTYYGVEVKSTKADHWTSTGSSIVESTRDINVDDIFMLFGKLGGNIPEFRCRPYEEVLYDIAVTHSPRYLIDMELEKNRTIFDKMGTTYDELRKSPEAIDKVRRYYRNKAQAENKLEMPWWITADNVEISQPFNIKLWNTLPDYLKDELQVKCMILFPEALNPARSKTKYNQTTLWLCSYNQVVVRNIRDFYSAGGQITHVNGNSISPVPQVFNRIVKYSDRIKDALCNPSDELRKLIEDYNPQLLDGGNPYKKWLDICLVYAEKEGVPLEEWINNKPLFSFSKKQDDDL